MLRRAHCKQLFARAQHAQLAQLSVSSVGSSDPSLCAVPLSRPGGGFRNHVVFAPGWLDCVRHGASMYPTVVARAMDCARSWQSFVVVFGFSLLAVGLAWGVALHLLAAWLLAPIFPVEVRGAVQFRGIAIPVTDRE